MDLLGDCINRTYLDLCLGEEPGPDFEGDDVVARHGADGAAHEGAPVRVTVVDLAAEGVVVVRLPLRPWSEKCIRSDAEYKKVLLSQPSVAISLSLPAPGLRAVLLVLLPLLPVAALEAGLHVRREDRLVALWK